MVRENRSARSPPPATTGDIPLAHARRKLQPRPWSSTKRNCVRWGRMQCHRCWNDRPNVDQIFTCVRSESTSPRTARTPPRPTMSAHDGFYTSHHAAAILPRSGGSAEPDRTSHFSFQQRHALFPTVNHPHPPAHPCRRKKEPARLHHRPAASGHGPEKRQDNGPRAP